MLQPQAKFAKTQLGSTLQRIVVDIVEGLGYIAAIVATYEADDSLPIRAFYIDPQIATMERIREWENNLSSLLLQPVSITNPDFARVYVQDKAYKNNLSVQAVQQKKPLVSDDLFALFAPVLPAAARPVISTIQKALGISEIIVIPFFLQEGGGYSSPVMGNLLAAKKSRITEEDKRILGLFGHQAATAVEITEAATEIDQHRQRTLQVARQLTTTIHVRIEKEADVLQHIVQGVVEILGYVGAMVATYEEDDSLPVRAVYVDPKLATMEQIHKWESAVSAVMRRPVSITDPDFAKVYVNHKKYKDNLSSQAVHQRKPVASEDLFSLFTPVIPGIAKPVVNSVIQRALGIKEVVAVPFFLYESDTTPPRIVGNLFAASTKPFQEEEIELLQAFGQQAAAGIRNAQLYRKAEERREIAAHFAKMAFNASTYLHELQNQISPVKMYLELPEVQRALSTLDDEYLRHSVSAMPERLRRVREILENIRKPFTEVSEELVVVNRCLEIAINKVAIGQITIHKDLAADIPAVKASTDMLTEAFKVLVKNAVEAIQVSGDHGSLWVESSVNDGEIKVVIQDTGIGVKPEDLKKIFDLGWTTKKTGYGFGLFWTKDYIEGLGGSVRVESEYGKGSSFYVTFPIAR